MNELIKITYNNENPTVSGRDLHEACGVGTEYRHWFPRMCEYGFVEGVDYTPVIFEHPQNHQPTTDHQCTISMAKEIAMLQRNEKGKLVRQYLIKLEEAWNTPEMVMSRALKLADTKINGLALANSRLSDEIEHKNQIIGELQPKADYLDHILSSTGTMATTQIAADYGMSANRLNKILNEEGVQRKVGGQWILYNEYMGLGYTKSETVSITRSDGRPDTKMFTRWTQKGRLLINEILNKRGIYANMDLIKIA